MVKFHTDFPDSAKDVKISLGLLIWLICEDIKELIPESFCFLIPME